MYSYLTYICYSYIYVTYMQHICGFGKGLLINNQNNFIKQSLKITIKNMLINNNNKKQKYPDCSMETQLLKRIILRCSDVLAALLTPH